MAKKKPMKRQNLPPTLRLAFKMTPQQVATLKRSGAGAHKSGPKHKARAELKRRALEDQV